MQCPFDAVPLQVVHRHGVEIDWCPSCKGVWLERGELDKLIERAVETDVREPRWLDDRDDRDDRYDRADRADRRRGRDEDRRYAPTPRRKKSFLSEMFDFGGD